MYDIDTHKKTVKEYNEDDSAFVANMSIKDSTFFHYITSYCNDGSLFTIQEKCERYIGKILVTKRYSQLLDSRKRAFLSVFSKNGTANRVKIHANENSIPYNGFSFFKIEYNGEKPEILQEAYQKLEDLNDETPRSRYRDARKKIKQMFKKK